MPFKDHLPALSVPSLILILSLFFTGCGVDDVQNPGETDPPAETELYDVGGEVFSSPGLISMRLEWGAEYENSKEIDIEGEGPYSFDVEIEEDEKYRISAVSVPESWACRGKLPDMNINMLAEEETNIYCGKTESEDGIRLATWNLEWYDSGDNQVKKQVIGDLINEWNFDVLVLTEILDDGAVQDLVDHYLNEPSDWMFSITESGCSLKKATLWRSSVVTFESGYELSAETTNGIIDENGENWSDCIGRRPYVSNFSVNNSEFEFTTASIHFKSGSDASDCFVRSNQVNTFIEWVEWAGLNTQNFAAIGDFNDEIPGTGICSSIDALSSMETLYPGFVFVTAQPAYDYSHMMGNGLVTFDTRSFQSTIDHIWITDSLFERLLTDVDSYGNYANTVQANMVFTDWGEPDHNPPFIVIQK